MLVVCPVLHLGIHDFVNARAVEEKVLCDFCTFACLYALLVACPCDLCLHLRVAFAVCRISLIGSCGCFSFAYI